MISSEHRFPVTHRLFPDLFAKALFPRLRAARLFMTASCAALVIGTSGLAQAQDFSRGTVLEDTEIGATLNAYARPLLIAAGLQPESVQIGMIVDDSMNAFATQGRRMYYHTGLLLRAQNANEVIGVMAHEIGHIAGGHVVLVASDLSGATTISLLSTLLGVAAGVASGNPEVGMAVMMGGQRAAIGEFLSFSRGQEARADQFALKALNDTQQSSQGLYNFFQRLASEERLITDNRDPYIRTHPLNQDRMVAIQSAMNVSPYTGVPLDPELERQHRRMIAKLFAFLKPQITTFQRYPESDKSIEARYARTIAYYRRGQFNEAFPILEGLLKDAPQDPYFWQIKGDMEKSRSRIDEAIVAYREALKILPNAPEILTSFAHSTVESGKPEYAAEGQAALKHALNQNPENPGAWDLLARSYLHSGDAGLSAYAAAERAILLGQFGDVARYSNEAEKLLEKGTPTWYRLQDIKVLAQNYLRDMRDRRR
jgi:predicted Zn-dependent protease